MWTDWIWLWFQTLLLVAIVAGEFRKAHGRNVFAILICSTFVALVQGQAFWVFGRFSKDRLIDFMHLRQSFTLDAARLANFYIGLCVVCLFITYCAYPRFPRRSRPAVAARKDGQLDALSYSLVGGLSLGSTVLLLASAGGLVSAITRPGQNFSSGVTMLMIAAGVGKLPFLSKLADRSKPNGIDFGLLAVAFAGTLLNSRFIAGFMLVQIAILWNYRVRETRRRSFAVLGFAMFVIFFVFGLYRHFTSLPNSLVTFDAAIAFLTLSDESPIDWFYRLNIEGFTGLAGILDYAQTHGGIAHDFGLSSLGFLLQFVPGSVRSDPSSLLGRVSHTLSSSYPYDGSIIPPGVEIAYAHLGVAGILLLGCLLGFLARWLHDALTLSATDPLSVGVSSVHVLEFIRGTFYLALFFGVSELIMVRAYRAMVRAGIALRTTPPIRRHRSPTPGRHPAV